MIVSLSDRVPYFRAFCDDLRFPSSLTGPVLLRLLAMFDSIFLCEVIRNSPLITTNPGPPAVPHGTVAEALSQNDLQFRNPNCQKIVSRESFSPRAPGSSTKTDYTDRADRAARLRNHRREFHTQAKANASSASPRTPLASAALSHPC
jgi:hypothetical protein